MHEIRCNDCGGTLGTVSVPSGAEIKKAAGDTVNAGLLAMLPNNIAEVFLSVVVFRCPTCTTKEIFHNGSKEENRQEVSGEADGKREAWSPFRRRRSDGGKGNGAGQ